MEEIKENKPIDKTMIIHLSVVFLFVGLCGIFFMLGGGSQCDTAEVKEANVDTIPDIMVEEVATNKLDAYKQAEAILEREQREKELQREHNSFDFFTKQLESPETLQEKEANRLMEETQHEEQSIAELKQSIDDAPKPVTRGGGKRRIRESEDEDIDYNRLIEEEKKKRHDELSQILSSKENQSENTQQATSKPQSNSPFKPINKRQVNNNKSITAVIHGEQKNITSSSLVKLRTQEPLEINGTTIPRNTIIYGKAQISSNRVNINIDQIIYNNTPYPFKGRIYDLNGSEGLYIPDNALNEGIKETKGDMIEGTDLTIRSGSVAGLVTTGANALTQAVKRMADGKNKETKVTLSANYKLIIVMD